MDSRQLHISAEKIWCRDLSRIFKHYGVHEFDSDDEGEDEKHLSDELDDILITTSDQEDQHNDAAAGAAASASGTVLAKEPTVQRELKNLPEPPLSNKIPDVVQSSLSPSDSMELEEMTPASQTGQPHRRINRSKSTEEHQSWENSWENSVHHQTVSVGAAQQPALEGSRTNTLKIQATGKGGNWMTYRNRDVHGSLVPLPTASTEVVRGAAVSTQVGHTNQDVHGSLVPLPTASTEVVKEAAVSAEVVREQTIPVLPNERTGPGDVQDPRLLSSYARGSSHGGSRIEAVTRYGGPERISDKVPQIKPSRYGGSHNRRIEYGDYTYPDYPEQDQYQYSFPHPVPMQDRSQFPTPMTLQSQVAGHASSGHYNMMPRNIPVQRDRYGRPIAARDRYGRPIYDVYDTSPPPLPMRYDQWGNPYIPPPTLQQHAQWQLLDPASHIPRPQSEIFRGQFQMPQEPGTGLPFMSDKDMYIQRGLQHGQNVMVSSAYRGPPPLIDDHRIPVYRAHHPYPGGQYPAPNQMAFVPELPGTVGDWSGAGQPTYQMTMAPHNVVPANYIRHAVGTTVSTTTASNTQPAPPVHHGITGSNIIHKGTLEHSGVHMGHFVSTIPSCTGQRHPLQQTLPRDCTPNISAEHQSFPQDVYRIPEPSPLQLVPGLQPTTRMAAPQLHTPGASTIHAEVTMSKFPLPHPHPAPANQTRYPQLTDPTNADNLVSSAVSSNMDSIRTIQSIDHSTQTSPEKESMTPVYHPGQDSTRTTQVQMEQVAGPPSTMSEDLYGESSLQPLDLLAHEVAPQKCSNTQGTEDTGDIVEKMIASAHCKQKGCSYNMCAQGKKIFNGLAEWGSRSFGDEDWERCGKQNRLVLRAIWLHNTRCPELACSVPLCLILTDMQIEEQDFSTSMAELKREYFTGLHVFQEEEGDRYVPLSEGLEERQLEKIHWEGVNRIGLFSNTFLAKSPILDVGVAQMHLWTITKVYLHHSSEYKENLESVLGHLYGDQCRQVITHLWYVAQQNHLYICTTFDGNSFHQNHLSPLEPHNVIRCIKQLEEAVKFLHSKSILYLNWKSSSVLINRDYSLVKLLNFTCAIDLSREVTEDELDNLKMLLHPLIIPPEVLQLEGLSLQTDIWGIGCLVYELFTGHKVHHQLRHLSPEEIRQNLEDDPSVDLGEVHDTELHAFLDACFQLDPGARKLLPIEERMKEDEDELAISTPDHQQISVESPVVSPDPTASDRSDSEFSNRENLSCIDSSDDSLAISERSEN